jgi:hypothetical protein
MRAAEKTIEYLVSRPALVDELKQLGEVLDDRVGLADEIYPVPEWPLALHRHYGRREIIAAVGEVEPGKKLSLPQGGIYKVGDSRRELLFVTLDKSGSDFSPSTRYRDYAISRELFHWETQGGASVNRPSGRRYLDSPGNGWSFYLFVRTDPDAAYAFLGPDIYDHLAPRSSDARRPVRPIRYVGIRLMRQETIGPRLASWDSSMSLRQQSCGPRVQVQAEPWRPQRRQSPQPQPQAARWRSRACWASASRLQSVQGSMDRGLREWTQPPTQHANSGRAPGSSALS